MAKYGASETNPIDDATRKFQASAERTIPWTSPELKRIVRLRLVSDTGYPRWDVTYCYGETYKGEAVRVELPFSQLPKQGMRRAIVDYAIRDRVNARNLGVFDNLSTLI